MNSNEKFDDQADVFAEEVEVNFDPECIIHIRPEFVDAAEHKKAHIIRKYDETVIRPQAEEARQQRQALLLNGQISQETAALDDELALMGLDPDEVRDTTMVAEYSEEIFAYMSECEMSTMAKPNYMDFQTEIQWYMRQTLVDWLLQVHVRYHMLPETLWIAVNIIDRFLSMRVVALQKLQLVGVTSMFIAAKYEEILAPSVEEFVFMTENGYSKEEILKGERIILSTLDFNISKYCTPYSWLRRISKADDYDIHSRTLAKFLMEVTLTDHRFLRAKPSMIAAMSMLLAKKMLGLEWNDAFVYYSKFTEQELVPGANLMLEKLIDPSFEEQFVCKKYSNRKFLKASIYAREWALQNHRSVAAAAAAEAGEEYDTSV
ncbi:A/B/D/E cyclin [Tilletiaria anomala UBC 951]|uniref:A/B/D/E cyclin n=1 Tax=Tilletiaria anomala (strain ATCC 24038 / CBS 436.72 / UBC 951) TaxID=1037660 RepID=A0A066WLF6_TILAU|nr:A/B/D/E cyclin [Tilletiaria anomala UBC 951]KDN53413.1 A/B/D/E cyclin [Tilletiaria anomala UBC 951]